MKSFPRLSLLLATAGFLVSASCESFRKLVAACAGSNRDGKYNQGEPLWIHRGADDNPPPGELDASRRAARVEVRGFGEDHVSILSTREAKLTGRKILDQAARWTAAG